MELARRGSRLPSLDAVLVCPGEYQRNLGSHRATSLTNQSKESRSLRFGTALLFFRAHTLFSNAKINPPWSRQIHLRSQMFPPQRECANFAELAHENRRVERFTQ